MCTRPSQIIRSAQYFARRPKRPSSDPDVICIHTPLSASFVMTGYFASIQVRRSGWVRIGT